MKISVLDLRSECGEIHAYVLAAGIIIVLVTAFLGMAEITSVDAAHNQVARALQASLRGAARMQDFQQEGRILPAVAHNGFETLLAANLALAQAGHDGNTLLLRPTGRHPYISGTAKADFDIRNNGNGDTLIARVRVPLRLPFIGPTFQRIYGHEVTVCEALAVTPHDLLSGFTVDNSIPIPAGWGC
ncbi:MAG: hypothetical protein JWN15_3504 [Firmicutes bacterium]|nr:hypothetical protein [Bacillota bacterium]